MMLTVRSSLLKLGAIALVAVCLGGHVSELFDRWEKTAISGDDVDYTVVLVAAMAGVALTLAKTAKRFFMQRVELTPHVSTCLEMIGLAQPLPTLPSHSPPISLRI